MLSIENYLQQWKAMVKMAAINKGDLKCHAQTGMILELRLILVWSLFGWQYEWSE